LKGEETSITSQSNHSNFFTHVNKKGLNVRVPPVYMSREEEASLLTYNTHREEFESVYERNKFYRGLFGYKQTVKKNGKKYEYEKDGLMDEIPNVRIDDSVFIISCNRVQKVEDYFLDWGEKVSHHIFTVLIEDRNIINQIKGEDKEDESEEAKR
jgi:hypothetical protein